MALPAGFLEELRARTPLAPLIGRRVKLERSGRDWKGCCPFHNEKTPSFMVYEDHFHCFGCGAHGDAFSFVMQSEGAAFIEAVRRLAAEAGMDVPQPSPEAAQAERARLELSDVLAAAAAACQRRLYAPEGSTALAYLRGRGLTEETITGWGLGWSGAGRGALAEALARAGIGPDRLVACGLMKEAERGPVDFFFNRVMFPIRDAAGQVISFGGRTLDDGQPKYLNGPETALFAKRRILFGLDRARAAAREGAAVVVVEGYMDVIALHQAGFRGALAPLGTALTEEQFTTLWRLTPEPILCFDGDAAGARAALRAALLALGRLAPERTLRLGTLPSGQDPDSLIRQHGPAGFQGVLETARPLVDALFQFLREGLQAESPESRAAFLARLQAAASRIPDPTLAREYARAFRERFYASRRGPRALRTVPPRPAPSEAATAGTRADLLTALLLHHPALLASVEEAYAGLDLPAPLAALRDDILLWHGAAPALDSAALLDHLRNSGLAAEAAAVRMGGGIPPAARSDDGLAEAETIWWHIYGLTNRALLDQEVAAAALAFAASASGAAERRLLSLLAAREALIEGEDVRSEDRAPLPARADPDPADPA